jgi:8-oxo-dGTP pyrophosphatase MutT (NUDIX family)
MYKVFFNDRKVILTDNFSKHFRVNFGLFYKYRDIDDLKDLIHLYSQLSRIDTLYLFAQEIEELREAFRKCFIPILAAGGLVRNPKGDFLLIHRRGRWDLPKGKLGRKESVEEAAVREVEEECGIKGVQLVKPLISTYHTYMLESGLALKKTSWFEMLYTGRSKPVPQQEEDINEVIWASPAKLKKYVNECYPAVQDVFKYYGV